MKLPKAFKQAVETAKAKSNRAAQRTIALYLGKDGKAISKQALNEALDTCDVHYGSRSANLTQNMKKDSVLFKLAGEGIWTLTPAGEKQAKLVAGGTPSLSSRPSNGAGKKIKPASKKKKKIGKVERTSIGNRKKRCKKTRAKKRDTLGAWIRHKRECLGLSTAQLSKKAKVSEMIILAIEGGIPASPPVRDLKCLQKALGTKIPPEIAKVDLKSISTKHKIHEFDPNSDSLPEAKGVYFLRDKCWVDRFTYIGSAWKDGRTIAMRIEDHRQKRWWPEAGKAYYVEINDSGECRRLEANQIWSCRPRYNDRDKPADPWDEVSFGDE